MFIIYKLHIILIYSKIVKERYPATEGIFLALRREKSREGHKMAMILYLIYKIGKIKFINGISNKILKYTDFLVFCILIK